MANWYVSSVKHNAISQWAASTAVSLGQYCRQLATPADANGRVFKCTTAGTTGGSEPSWSLGNNATTNDGTAVWTQVGGQEAEQSAGNWKAALPTLGCLNVLGSAGDIGYVASDHAESRAIGKSLSTSALVICANSGGSVPPVEADLTTGASVETTGNNIISISSSTIYGVKFICGTGSSSATHISFTGNSYLENCELVLASTSTSALIQVGTSSTGGGFVEWVNTKFTPQNTSQQISGAFSELLWRDTAAPFGATVPTTPFQSPSTNGSRFIVNCRNLDLSGVNSNMASLTAASSFTFDSCKIHASAGLSPNVTSSGNRAPLRFHNCDDGTTNLGFNFREKANLIESVADSSIFRSGGASDGTNSFSVSSTTGNNSDRLINRNPSMKVLKRYNTLNSAKTFTLHGLINFATLPTRPILFCEFTVADDSNTPRATLFSTRSSLLDTRSVETTTENWSGTLPARTDSTLRTAGYLFQVASNPGRVFVVVSTGTTAASEPGNYATAVDGGSFSDGTATVRALWRVKFAVTATPRRRGMVSALTYFHGGNGARLWIDPKIEVS